MKALLFIISTALPAVTARHGPSVLTTSKHRGVFRTNSASRRFVVAFGSPKYFTNRYIPSDKAGVVLKVPNFDALLGEICNVSPLAKQAMTEENPGGIKAIDSSADVYKWKVTDNNPKRLVYLDKIDNFQNKGVPLLRARSSLSGPTKKRAECFSELVSTTHLRAKWDATIDMVETIYSAGDLKEVDKLQGHKYGKCSLFGIGYVRTKKSVVSPREQMTLCGLQNFPSGASVIWGVELEEDQNHLFPENHTRMPRSTSHLWATTLIPTGEDTFDVEYILQVEVGGFPGWLTGPIVIDTVKKMFRFADGYFKGGLNDDGGELAKRLALFSDDDDDVDGKDDETDVTEGSILGELSSSESLSADETAVLEQRQTLLMPP